MAQLQVVGVVRKHLHNKVQLNNDCVEYPRCVQPLTTKGMISQRVLTVASTIAIEACTKRGPMWMLVIGISWLFLVPRVGINTAVAHNC
jgi:hypothetical protein